MISYALMGSLPRYWAWWKEMWRLEVGIVIEQQQRRRAEQKNKQTHSILYVISVFHLSHSACCYWFTVVSCHRQKGGCTFVCAHFCACVLRSFYVEGYQICTIQIEPSHSFSSFKVRSYPKTDEETSTCILGMRPHLGLLLRQEVTELLWMQEQKLWSKTHNLEV